MGSERTEASAPLWALVHEEEPADDVHIAYTTLEWQPAVTISLAWLAQIAKHIDAIEDGRRAADGERGTY